MNQHNPRRNPQTTEEHQAWVRMVVRRCLVAVIVVATGAVIINGQNEYKQAREDAADELHCEIVYQSEWC